MDTADLGRSHRRGGGMSPRLITINADDLGLHEAVNEGIIRAHQDGVVTSASIIACGRAFDDALIRCKSCPELDLGVHLTLVGERPLAPIEKVVSLVDEVRGSAFSGRLTTARLLSILETLRPGMTEILVHPGIQNEDLARRYGHWEFDWAAELRALTDALVITRCRRGDFTLTRFSEMKAFP